MTELDYSKHKEVVAHDLKMYLGVTMCPIQLKKDLDFMVKEAEKRGYKDVRLQFESHYEPYEDWLGQPSVSPVGWVSMTEQDIQDELDNAKAEALAKELGTFVTAAREILRLKEEEKL